MMITKTEMEVLKVKPILESGEFHQKCLVGADLFGKIGANIGSFIELKTYSETCVCSLWLKPDLDINTLVYSGVVYCLRNYDLNASIDCGEKEPLYNNTFKNQERTELQSKTFDKSVFTCEQKTVGSCGNRITVLDTVKAAEVTVVVVLYKLNKVKEFTTNKGLLKQLEVYCNNVLMRLCVKPAFVINCTASRLASKYGISHITVRNVTSESNVKQGAGYVINKMTRVIVDTVHSQEWFEQISRPKSTLKKPGGLDSVIQMLLDLIVLPLEQREKFKHLGTQCPTGVLLCGPPGCGKTSIVKYICAVNDIFLVTVNGSEVFGPRPGETEGNLRKVFTTVTLMSEEGPCILFIDEIDSLCSSRNRSGSLHEARATAQFLSLMDGLGEVGNILVIGATNRPSALDPALRRPGRLDREITISSPTCQERSGILSSLIQDLPKTDDLDLEKIAETTNGYVGADLVALCHEAAYLAMSESTGNCTNLVRQDHFQTAFKTIRPSLQKGAAGIVDLRPVYWSDIGGLDTVKKKIKQAVEWPLKHPEAFERMGLKPPKGVLLYGPPGCCKTTLVRAAATACHSTFLSLSGAQLYSPYVGDSEKLVTEVFQKARACAPSILFLDELDSIVGKRSESGHRGVQERILSTLLNEMDGIGVRLSDGVGSCQQQKTLEGESTAGLTDSEVKTVENRSVLVVAATNRPDLIDEALMRPGRMDRIIYVQHPDIQARKDILKLYTRNMQLLNCDLDLLAQRTDLYTGADLESLCREAALFALTGDIDTSTVSMEQFEKALTVVPPSLTTGLIEQYANITVR